MSDLLDLVRELLRIEGAKDSLEIGTPGKSGALKIYVDFSDVEGTKEKIRKAIEARRYANELLEKTLMEGFESTLHQAKAPEAGK